MTSDKLYAHVLLDRSGSMNTNRADAVGGYNAYVAGLPDDAKVSLTIFDSQGIDLIRDRVGKVEAILRYEEFQPRGGTPLLDAIGKTVAGIAGQAQRDERVAFVILTDGEENESREWTPAKIKDLLQDKQDSYGWLVIYLGANQDAWQVGQGLGINRRNTMDYNPVAMASTFSSAARATASYASAHDRAEGLVRSGFTDEERSKSK